MSEKPVPELRTVKGTSESHVALGLMVEYTEKIRRLTVTFLDLQYKHSVRIQVTSATTEFRNPVDVVTYLRDLIEPVEELCRAVSQRIEHSGGPTLDIINSKLKLRELESTLAHAKRVMGL
jgi:hypothetical protein